MGTSGTNTVNLFVVTAGSVKNGKILAKTVCRIYKVTRLGDLSPIGRLSKTLAIDFLIKVAQIFGNLMCPLIKLFECLKRSSESFCNL